MSPTGEIPGEDRCVPFISPRYFIEFRGAGYSFGGSYSDWLPRQWLFGLNELFPSGSRCTGRGKAAQFT